MGIDNADHLIYLYIMSKQLKPISSQTYVNRHDTAQCPLCLSFYISSDRVDMDGSIGTANVECMSCGSYWTDILHITSYSNLNENMTPAMLAKTIEKAKKVRAENLA